MLMWIKGQVQGKELVRWLRNKIDALVGIWKMSLHWWRILGL